MKPYEEQTDEELLERCKNSDEGAFTALYRRYRLQLFSYLHKLLPGNNPMVDDFFQQTWGKAAKNIRLYNHQQKFLAWLCRIAHNLVMDHFRKIKDTTYVELDEQHVGESPAIEQMIDDQELYDALENAILTLVPEQRDVLEMRRKGMSFKEIAEAQKSNINTVLGRMHYAIGKLKELLSNYA